MIFFEDEDAQRTRAWKTWPFSEEGGERAQEQWEVSAWEAPAREVEL